MSLTFIDKFRNTILFYDSKHDLFLLKNNKYGIGDRLYYLSEMKLFQPLHAMST